MRKNIKKFALLLVMIMITSMLFGCGKSFDASTYVQALLDNSYKNDSSKFVEMNLGTVEEANSIYEEGIELEVSSMLDGIDDVPFSDEVLDAFRQTFRNVFAKAKYTVKEATKQEDGSYEVVISYETMSVFTAATENYSVKADEYTSQMYDDYLMTEQMPSDEEIYNSLFMILNDCIVDALDNATYSAPQDMIFHVELVDGVYQPSQEDSENLEMLLFDLYE